MTQHFLRVSATPHYKQFVDDADAGAWNRLVARLVFEHGKQSDVAQLMLNEAVGFMRVCLSRPSWMYGAPAPVALAWQVLILDTRLYQQLCWKLGGGFVRRIPTDGTFVDAREHCLIPATYLARRRQEGAMAEGLWGCRHMRPVAVLDHGCGQGCPNGVGAGA